MSALSIDTNALAKRYVAEAGPAWIQSVTDPNAGHVVLIAAVTTVEVFSLFARRVRDGTLQPANTVSLGQQFLLHAEREYLVVATDTPLLAQARSLIGHYPLRTLDAIQLASAQRAAIIIGEPVTFISSDRNLLAAAQSEGLRTDDPLSYP